MLCSKILDGGDSIISPWRWRQTLNDAWLRRNQSLIYRGWGSHQRTLSGEAFEHFGLRALYRTKPTFVRLWLLSTDPRILGQKERYELYPMQSCSIRRASGNYSEPPCPRFPISSRPTRIYSPQIWLTMYHLLCEEECRRRYHFNSMRKGNILRVRKYLNDVLLDQLPVLADVQR